MTKTLNECALFDSMVNEIRLAYDAAADLSLGWRFLYSPKLTLTRNTGLAIFGYNPGGPAFEPPIPSVEAGNAWLTSVERWPSANTQPNFMRFMGKALRQVANGQIAQYLTRSLTSNLIPFRSKSAMGLPRWAHDWGISFWTKHIELIRSQEVIVAVGNASGDSRSPFAGIAKVLLDQGAALVASEDWPSGWGEQVVRFRRFSSGESTVSVIGVPHFSRFDTRDTKTIERVTTLMRDCRRLT